MKSYWCFKCFMHDTQAVHITDTLKWFLDKLIIPTPMRNDLILAGISDIKLASLNSPTISTMALLDTTTISALNTLKTVLHCVYQPNDTTVDTIHLVAAPTPLPLLLVLPQVTAIMPSPEKPTPSPRPPPAKRVAPLRVPIQTPTAPTQAPISPRVVPGSYTDLMDWGGWRSLARCNKRIAAKDDVSIAIIKPPAPVAPNSDIPILINQQRWAACNSHFNPHMHQQEFAASAFCTTNTVALDTYKSAFLGHAINPDTG